jgi:tRNA A-37 threonylcarbamoyl transferase component Bud32
VKRDGPGSDERDALAIEDTLTASPEDTPSRHPLTEDALPAAIGRFTIEARLGAGGMGEVLLAADPVLGRKVAIKLLRREERDESRKRFLREAQAMARVTHENIIVVHDVGTDGGQVFIAMELVAGGTLRRWQAQADRDWRAIVAAYRHAGRGLLAAHAAGLVHRDFKPDNVLVGDDGKVRVTDFGLVAAVEDRERASPPVHPADLEASLTQTGSVMGTPRYMAPEQHLGEPVDARADQFAFCVALHEALYRQPPFAGDTYAALAEHVLAGDLRPPPRDTPVPPRVHAAIERGLSRERDQRFASMAELLAELDAALAPPAPTAAPRPSRWRTWAALAATAAVLAAAAFFALAARRDADAQRRRALELDRAIGELKATDDMGAAAERYEKASKAIEAERYDEAALLFLDAYGAGRMPQLLYNVGAAFQLKGRKHKDASAYRQAGTYYRRYLAELPDAEDRDKVEHTIRTIEAEATRLEQP